MEGLVEAGDSAVEDSAEDWAVEDSAEAADWAEAGSVAAEGSAGED